jgi:phosphoribosyl 1,2-cyclic phosphodiesterase
MGHYKEAGLRLEVLGTRGSNPIFGEPYAKYGGSTSCYHVTATTEDSQETIILDAGSGIVNAADIETDRITILLSHSHLDHILGLMVFPYLNDLHKSITIYLAKRNGLSAREQIDALISEPLWPCKLEAYKAKVEVKDMPKTFDIGNVHVDTMESNHPGGSSIMKLSFDGKTFVYATDYEHGDAEKEKELQEFSKDADLLFYDAQYTTEEYPKYKGFGHSTPEEGLKLKEISGAKELAFIHHSAQHNDLFLYQEERKYVALGAHFAREGEVFYL